MNITADRYENPKLWNYLIGDYHFGRSIGQERYEHLRLLNDLSDNTLKIAFLDRQADQWTKWTPWYGSGWKLPPFNQQQIQTAYDVHRSVLDNEVVIESDYPTYQENAEAARTICKILEMKGFTPHIYYSGSKSVHVHVYFDWTCLFSIDKFLQEKLKSTHLSGNVFKKKFITWLRAMMISCWGIEARKFDEQLKKATHLIRAELSQNKIGFKTFLGYTYKDIPPFPVICNEESEILPELGELHFSRPHQIQEIVEEYVQTKENRARKKKAKQKEASLMEFFHPHEEGATKGCVSFMLSDTFFQAGDGFQRAMFLIYNELYQTHGTAAQQVVLDWNLRAGSPVPEQDILYRFAQGKTYTFSHETIHEFLRAIGFSNADELCVKEGKH